MQKFLYLLTAQTRHIRTERRKCDISSSLKGVIFITEIASLRDDQFSLIYRVF